MAADLKGGSHVTRRQMLGRTLGMATGLVLAPSIGFIGGPRIGDTALAQTAAPRRLAGITSWAYQLQQADFAELARSPYDVLVVDSTKNGNAETPLTPADVKRLQTRPDGRKRIVLTYFSIGEAEDYRFYWQEDWLEVATPDEPEPGAKPKAGKAAAKSAKKKGNVPEVSAHPDKPDRWVSPDKAPKWLGDENETWGGNFDVKYWDPDWQKLIFGDPAAFMERVIAQGFDGLYLDRVDAYYNHIDERPTANDDMVDFVIRLAAAARALKPNCIIVPQNAEELLGKPGYLDVIDGIAKEDLLYGSVADGELNAKLQLDNSVKWLSPAKDQGLAVLVVEYLDRADLRATSREDIGKLGFVPYFGPRSLDRLLLPDTPAAIKAAQVAAAAAAATAAKAAASPGAAKKAAAKPASTGKADTKKRRRR